MKPLHRRHGVLLDLAESYAWLAERNPEAAERFLEAVESSFQQIRRHPGIGWARIWKNRRLDGMRSWRVEGFQDYLIFYREEASAIQVYAVLHGSQHLERALKGR